jgi:hypothetical protein
MVGIERFVSAIFNAIVALGGSGAEAAGDLGIIAVTNSDSLVINVNSDAPITFDPSILTVVGGSSRKKTIIVLLLKINKI